MGSPDRRRTRTLWVGLLTGGLVVGATAIGLAQSGDPQVTQRDPEEWAATRPTSKAARLAAAAEALPSLTGIVTGANGDPVSGYLVEAFTSDGNFMADTVTDDTGHYAFPTLQAGPYKVKASPGKGSTTRWAAGWAGPATNLLDAQVILLGNAAVTADIVLPAAAELKGTVTGLDGRASLRACGASFLDCRIVEIDQDGRFTAGALPAGATQLTVWPAKGTPLLFPKDPPRDGVPLVAGATTRVALDARTQSAPQVLGSPPPSPPPTSPPPATASPTTAPPSVRPTTSPRPTSSSSPRPTTTVHPTPTRPGKPTPPAKDTTPPTIRGAHLKVILNRRSVSVRATDAASGMARMTVRVGIKKPRTRSYTSNRVRVARHGTVRVKVADRAGNWTTWKRAR